MEQKQIYTKLNQLEKEIKSLRIFISLQYRIPKKVVSIGGMLRGIVISEEDFILAKRSLFKF